MDALQRNGLVWLTAPGWDRVLSGDWDAQALGILRHWALMALPLVVCRQRVENFPPTISLGLPAPSVWDRRKLALEVMPDEVGRVGWFPSFEQLKRFEQFEQFEQFEPREAFIATINEVRSNAPGFEGSIEVYGSFGWETLTGMSYVRPSSDLDLRVAVPDRATAAAVARALNALQLPIRVDGELAFPDGSAIAWREYLQWVEGKVDRMLVKSRTSIGFIE
jgi:phosphoribosyl-dephospho-CoA transferase